ncbi:MAG: sensor histidine kinase [Cytophagaceae bacterium]
MAHTNYIELRKYADFLLDNHLDTFTNENVRLAKEYGLPANQVIFSWKEEDYYHFIKNRTEIFLRFFKQEDPVFSAIKELEKWKTDTIPKVEGRILRIEDLTGSYNIRKVIITKLLPCYTRDIDLLQQVLLEFENFYWGWQKEAFKILFEMQSSLLIEEINKQTKELSEKNKELVKINSDLDNFIYTASHDLKAPVSNIEGLIDTLQDLLMEKDVEDEEVNMIFNMISKSINRFQGTLKDLTEISKVQKDVNLDVSEINVEEIIKEVLILIEHGVRESGAIIRFNTLNCQTVHFSRNNFRSIVYNLVSNAIKYRHTDRKPEILISAEETEDYFILKVSDNGMGIEKEHIPRMFEMFRRMHNHVEGTGIGLYLVKRIMQNAGGKIEVDTVLDKGTTFTLYFKRS